MTISSSVLRDAASIASSVRNISRAGPSRLPSTVDPSQSPTSPNCIVLHEVPRTATTRDVLRALQETQVVKFDFPASDITMPPPSFPRTPSLTKSVHVALPRGVASLRSHALDSIRKNPLFPDLTPVPRDGRHRPSGNLGMRILYNAATCHMGARDWTKTLLDSLPQPDSRLHQRRRNDGTATDATDVSAGSEVASGGGGDKSGMKYGNRTGWNAERGGVVAEIPDNDWCRATKDKGKRVVIKGLPGQVDQRFVRLLANDCGVEQGNGGREEGDDVKRLPPSAGAFVSTWVVTTNSIANACRLVRKLNREYYFRARFGERYLLRAEIAW